MDDRTPLAHLRRAVDLAGGQSSLVRRVRDILDELESDERISQPKLWNWLNVQDRVPGEFCIPIEMAVDGAVTRQQLRPDLYPAESQSTAAE